MTGWTDSSDVRLALERRWRSGAVLKAYAAGEPFGPISVPLKRPGSADLLERRDEINAWVGRLLADCAATSRRPGLRIESTPVPSRTLGRNELPRRVWADSYETFFGWLGVRRQVADVDRALASTRSTLPALVPWAVAHPEVLLAHGAEWPQVLATLDWILAHDQHVYLRQVDVPAVDTKFIERNRVLLARLLDELLPPGRVDQRFEVRDFAARYRFRRRPHYTRFRSLDPAVVVPGGWSELTVRTEEFAALDIPANDVVIVENEISYLALPERAGTVAIFGAGFALGSVQGLGWLADRRILYWGDIDTHGFAILSRLRAWYPDVRSVLMDVETLLAHPTQWVVEERPTEEALPHLTEPEAALYRDLVEDRHGHHVRLEQERVAYSRVLAALAPAGDTSGE